VQGLLPNAVPVLVMQATKLVFNMKKMFQIIKGGGGMHNGWTDRWGTHSTLTVPLPYTAALLKKKVKEAVKSGLMDVQEEEIELYQVLPEAIDQSGAVLLWPLCPPIC
jgi:hypothetical protein